MVVPLPASEALRLLCPACGRYLATADATYLECPPCACGVQVTIRVVGRRARQTVQIAGQTIEVKANLR